MLATFAVKDSVRSGLSDGGTFLFYSLFSFSVVADGRTPFVWQGKRELAIGLSFFALVQSFTATTVEL